MLKQSKAHLMAADERYFEHMRFASTVGLLTIAAGLACLIHALVPALCTRTASRTVGRLAQLFERRELLGEVEEQSLEATAFVMLLALATAVSAPLWLMDVPVVLRVAYTALAFALPLTLLLSNRELDCPIRDEAPLPC